MHWRITHYPPGALPSRDYVLRARTLAAAKQQLAGALGVPAWTLRSR